ncbi:MAG: Sua5/YciO/YrdC/YwlC family protein [Pseudohongiellaceae bacterium]
MHSIHLQQAVRHLNAGNIIAYPTEAVWGLGCDPFNELAVLGLLQIKRRPVSKGMILIAGDMARIAPWLEALTPAQRRRLDETWPGPVTWLLPDPHELAPPWIRGAHDKVAIRVSAHPLVEALCRKFGGPVVSTSANRAGRAPARNRLQLAAQLNGCMDFIVPGALGRQQQPSAIRDIETGEWIRGG